MNEHVNQGEEQNPLFLYVSYNAAHSPLQVFYNSLLCAKKRKIKKHDPRHQPEEEDEGKCIGIKNLWRRQFCGMVVGLDRFLAVQDSSISDIVGLSEPTNI